MKTKLTLVSAQCRGIKVIAFIDLRLTNGKAIISNSTLDDMFFTLAGFVPQRGETISIGI